METVARALDLSKISFFSYNGGGHYNTVNQSLTYYKADSFRLSAVAPAAASLVMSTNQSEAIWENYL